VSKHVLRVEREFQLLKQILSRDEGNAEHFIHPIELIKIAPVSNEDSGLAISIFECPGSNYLQELVFLESNVYTIQKDGQREKRSTQLSEAKVSLSQFLPFAIGAAKCLEILHHQNRMVHGEVRGDAFHFHEQTGQVKLMNFGSGTRSFENGLSSAGWYSLSREGGIEYKLRFIAPEQTGRLPAQPDGRTDIYSLGVLFWCMLTVRILPCFLASY
jgi:serine/threonine protein kinase